MGHATEALNWALQIVLDSKKSQSSRVYARSPAIGNVSSRPHCPALHAFAQHHGAAEACGHPARWRGPGRIRLGVFHPAIEARERLFAFGFRGCRGRRLLLPAARRCRMRAADSVMRLPGPVLDRVVHQVRPAPRAARCGVGAYRQGQARRSRFQPKSCCLAARAGGAGRSSATCSATVTASISALRISGRAATFAHRLPRALMPAPAAGWFSHARPVPVA